MRTVTYGGAVSLDGFLAGLNGEIDWLHYSKDAQQVMTEYWKRPEQTAERRSGACASSVD